MSAQALGRQQAQPRCRAAFIPAKNGLLKDTLGEGLALSGSEWTWGTFFFCYLGEEGAPWPQGPGSLYTRISLGPKPSVALPQSAPAISGLRPRAFGEHRALALSGPCSLTWE